MVIDKRREQDPKSAIWNLRSSGRDSQSLNNQRTNTTKGTSSGEMKLMNDHSQEKEQNGHRPFHPRRSRSYEHMHLRKARSSDKMKIMDEDDLGRGRGGRSAGPGVTSEAASVALCPILTPP